MKILSLFLSLIITLYSGILNFVHCGEQRLYDSGLSHGFLPAAIAEKVREIELEKAEYPSSSGNVIAFAADDTEDDFVTDFEFSLTAQTWRMTELTLDSDKAYDAPLSVKLDIIIVNGDYKLTIPGFWAGGTTWKIRFALPYEGEWKFKTVCSDTENTGLDGRTGFVNCEKYDGDLDVYSHGFVTTAFDKKYFTYSDGTPFFYLGDTHWSLGDETVDMVAEIAGKRAQQGFTVWQSEPIGAKFNFEDGITESDIAGLREYDKKFEYIAENGLTHACSEFFYPYSMVSIVNRFGGTEVPEFKQMLEEITRYWVARYSAYPVMWTLGQEVDRDFYGAGNPLWNYENNPYKLVSEYIAKYDAYSHPLSAHQENAGMTTASNSAFRDVKAHTWYAAQWSPALTEKCDERIPKDYWENSAGKPAINYEGRYCWLWTKNFGSRMQGWASYLSGLYGYGWGAHDTWSYLNIYDEENNSSDGVDTITSEEKINATWQDALEYPSSYQVGYMRKFFESIKWYELIPRFNNILFFARDAGVYAYAASNADNSEMVIYFYSFADESIAEKPNADLFGGTMTGRIGCLEPNTQYKYKWFDPVNGEFSEEGSFVSTPFGTYTIGPRVFNGEQVCRDMVFYMYK